jgi:RNA polymerase sigma-70 factor (ECF subfamily)
VTFNEASLQMLMVRSLDGDAAAYRQLLAGCRQWLMRYFARRMAPSQIDDLIQCTLMSVHDKRATYDPERPFLPWLAAIARYRWIDQLRKTTRAGEVELDDAHGVDSDEDDIIARLSLGHLLDQIRPEQALVIKLVKIDGLSIIEAAAQANQSESLVKVNIHRGLKRMAALVESAE